jgi:tight adherence protein B
LRTMAQEPSSADVNVRGSVRSELRRDGAKSSEPMSTGTAVANRVLRVAQRAELRLSAGRTLADAVAEEGSAPWRLLGVALLVAERSGAPMAASMERVGHGLAAVDAAAEHRRVLLTGPRTTIMLVAALPLLAAAFGTTLGFDPLSVLFGQGGAFILSAGFGLLATGIAWAWALVRRIERTQRVVGVELELVWVALQGGGPPGPALRQVADATSRLGAEWVRIDGLGVAGPTRRAISTAARTGVAAGPLLLAEATGERESSVRALERAAERLGVTILLPIGSCVLPSFVVLGVVPVLIAMLGAP